MASGGGRTARSSRAIVAAAVLALLVIAPAATQAAFPERPIRFILGFGAGGPTDAVARILADQVSRTLGQTIVVENRTGASGNLATQAVANAEADGYTFLIGANPLAVNETLFPDFPVKFGRDLVAVAGIGATASVLVVPPSLGVHTVAEFAQRARAKARGVSYATVGIGSSSHLAGELFEARTGSKMLAVAYRGGGEALTDLLAGRVDAWFAPVPSVLGMITSGKLVALASTGPQRLPWLPDVPTAAEAGYPGYDVRVWVGVFARAGVPQERLQVVEHAIEAAMVTDAMRAALERQGITPSSMSPAQFHEFVQQQVALAKSVIVPAGK